MRFLEVMCMKSGKGICLVNHDRDIPVYPKEEELLALKRDPEIGKFLKK